MKNSVFFQLVYEIVKDESVQSFLVADGWLKYFYKTWPACFVRTCELV